MPVAPSEPKPLELNQGGIYMLAGGLGELAYTPQSFKHA